MSATSAAASAAPRLDKKALKAAIDAGEQIDGVYVERSERLEIKL